MSIISSALNKLNSQGDYTPVAVRPFSEEELKSFEQSRRLKDEVVIQEHGVIQKHGVIQEHATAVAMDMNQAVFSATQTLDFSAELNHTTNVYNEDSQWSAADDQLIIEINDPATTTTSAISPTPFSPVDQLDRLAKAVEFGLSDEFDSTPSGSKNHEFEEDQLEVIVQDERQSNRAMQKEFNRASDESAVIARSTIFSPVHKLAEVKPTLRKLCQRILAQIPSTEPSSMVFLRCSTEEDTTSTIADLAVVFSKLDQGEVLVIDATSQIKATDSNGPHKQHGFYQLVTGQSTCEESIFATATAGVSIMPCGANADLLDDAEYQKQYLASYHRLLSQLKDRFQFILIDGGSITPFSKTLAAECEAKYLLLQLNESSRDSVEESITLLSRWNQPADGCILLD